MQGTETLTGFKKYISLTRPHTLTASFIPVLVGSSAALLYGEVRIDIFMLMLIATLLIQSATNMFNEYFDFKRGLDSKESVGIAVLSLETGCHRDRYISLRWYFMHLQPLLEFTSQYNLHS